MSDAIIWGIIWLVAAFLGSWLIYTLFGLISIGLATFANKVWLAPIGVAVGFILALSWFILAAYNTVQQIIAIVQFASGVAG